MSLHHNETKLFNEEENLKDIVEILESNEVGKETNDFEEQFK